MIILNRSLSWVVALCRISSSVVGLISGVPTSAAPRLVLQISDLHLRRYPIRTVQRVRQTCTGCLSRKTFICGSFSRRPINGIDQGIGIIVRCDLPWISFMCFQKDPECEVDESVPNIAVLPRVVASARLLFRSRWVRRFLFCLKASRFSTDGFFLSLLRAECFSL